MDWQDDPHEAGSQTWYGEARSLGLGQPPGRDLDASSLAGFASLDLGNALAPQHNGGPDYGETVRRLLHSRRRLRERRHPAGVDPIAVSTRGHFLDDDEYFGGTSALSSPRSATSSFAMPEYWRGPPSPVSAPTMPMPRKQNGMRNAPPAPVSLNPTSASRQLLEKLAPKLKSSMPSITDDIDAASGPGEADDTDDEGFTDVETDMPSMEMELNDEQAMHSEGKTPTGKEDVHPISIEHPPTGDAQSHAAVEQGPFTYSHKDLEDEDLPVAKAIQIKIVRPSRSSSQPDSRATLREQPALDAGVQVSQPDEDAHNLPVATSTTQDSAVQTDDASLEKDTEAETAGAVSSVSIHEQQDVAVQTAHVSQQDASTETEDASASAVASDVSSPVEVAHAAVQTDDVTETKESPSVVSVGTDAAAVETMSTGVDPIPELAEILDRDLLNNKAISDGESLRQTLGRIQERLEAKFALRPTLQRSRSNPEDGFVRSMAVQYEERLAVLQEEIRNQSSPVPSRAPSRAASGRLASSDEPAQEDARSRPTEAGTFDRRKIASDKTRDNLGSSRARQQQPPQQSQQRGVSSHDQQEDQVDWKQKIDDVRSVSSAVSDQVSDLRRINQLL
ncbi:Hypothetical Protein FCC1311_092332 [Hondaea fermentalgiana]|uniref:Uncharacterized protein n=1 Tax=Hondaea fermentalgiana TaxID=2315210 RepID=A0A2R5GRS5_9STRA|nr:Hypothetical Protein FCC1311_092332 [Hondaea fermentalgiana]|eukprot:GBG33009.1 Hypothetical Protein FCC1311_092332 [Hondaea fermentalgiana]